MRKRTTNTGMWLPSATSIPSFFFLASFLNSSSGTLFLSHWVFCENPQEIFRPWGSSGFILVWISVISITGEPQLSHGSSGFPSWAALLGWQGCVAVTGGGERELVTDGSAAAVLGLFRVPDVADVHSVRYCINTKDYFPPWAYYPAEKPLSLPQPIAKDPGTFFCLSIQCSLDYSSIILKQFWSCSVLLSCTFSCAYVFPRHRFTWSLTFLSRMEGWDSPLPKPSQL